VFDWLFARHTGGDFVLRIEDTDRARLVEGALEEIQESLKWLGAEYDEGPGIGGPFGPYFQSERLNLYSRYAAEMLARGDAYYCFCTPDRLSGMRKEQEAKKESTGYDRCCLSLNDDEVKARLSDGVPAVIRFRVPEEGATVFTDAVRGEISFENRLLDDFVILKSDGFPTYHFASIIDDHLMEITHVIRGEEWISSTPKHVLMYKSMGWNPPVWVHPPLILGPDKTKLSKRHGAVRFLDYKEKGFLPEAIMNFITLLGWSPGEDQELFSVDELIERFNIEGIVNHPVVFDIEKLEWMNGVYMRAADVERITELCLPYLQQAGLVPANPDDATMAYIRQVIGLVKDRMKVLTDVTDMADFFLRDELSYEEKGFSKWLSSPETSELLRNLAARFENLQEFTVEAIEEEVRKSGEDMGISGGPVVHPVRMAVTGRTVGPGLFESMAVLGRDRVIRRLNHTIGAVSDSRDD
jgi:glutamyl-tRNA synthetase